MILYIDQQTQLAVQQVLRREAAMPDGTTRHLLRHFLFDHLTLYCTGRDDLMTAIQVAWNRNDVHPNGVPKEFNWMEWGIPVDEYGMPVRPSYPIPLGTAHVRPGAEPSDNTVWLRGMNGGIIDHAGPDAEHPSWSIHT